LHYNVDGSAHNIQNSRVSVDWGCHIGFAGS